MGCGKSRGQLGSEERRGEAMKNMAECARSAVMLDRKASNYADIVGVAQGCTLSPNPFKIHSDDMTVAVEAAKQGVKVGEDTVLALMFADNFVGIP